MINIALYLLFLLTFPFILYVNDGIFIFICFLLLLLTWFVSIFPISFYIIGFSLNIRLLLLDFYIKILQLALSIFIIPNSQREAFGMLEGGLLLLALVSVILTVQISKSFATENITLWTLSDKIAEDDITNASLHSSLDKSLWLLLPPPVLSAFWDIISINLYLFVVCCIAVLLIEVYIVKILLQTFEREVLCKSFFHVPFSFFI